MKKTTIALCLALVTNAHSRAQVTVVNTTIYKAPPGSFPVFGYQMSIGNADGDASFDLYVCDEGINTIGKVIILPGPLFTVPIAVKIPNSAGVFAQGTGWKVADVNLDGLDDVITGAAGSKVSGQEDVGRTFVSFAPTFQGTVELQLPEPPTGLLLFGIGTDVGDYTGDGLPDIFVGSSGAKVNHVIGAGRIDVYSGATGFAGAPVASLLPPNPHQDGQWGYSLTVADYDGNGNVDLLTHDTSSFSWLNGFNPNNLLNFPGPPVSFTLGIRTRLGDMNDDGTIDVVASDVTNQQAVIFRGPTFSAPQFLKPVTATTGAQAGIGLALGDINRDGVRDVVVGAPYDKANGLYASGRVTVFYGPDYATTQAIGGEFQNSNFGMGVIAHDFDGDGFAELLVAAGGEWGGGSLHLLKHEPLALLTSNTVSLSAGGSVKFALQRGALSATAPYLMLMSATGSTPGIDIPSAGGSVHLPLNFDAATMFGIQFVNSPVFPDFSGTLDPNGLASPRFIVPPGSSQPALVGLNLTFAAVIGETGPYVDYATNAKVVVLGA